MFNRKLENEILRLAVSCYPAFCHWELKNLNDLKEEYPEICGSNRDQLWAEVNYLREHGLLILDSTCSHNSGIEGIIGYIKTTAKGIDFIQDDGGISAILNVQTIKFHREAVVVLEDLIAISNMSKDEKERAKSALSELPLEALKSVVQAVTTAGLAALTK
ncbi:hypothetical protein P2W49_11750 [Yersinia intermedia]|nr:hypothetical protein P2W49_11750 [Yersinia intermedia]